MFQLLRFNEDFQTHKVSAMIEYEWKDGKSFTDSKHFENAQMAALWINTHRLRYIRAKLKSFVDHKKVLSEVSKTWSEPERLAEKYNSLEISIRESMRCQEMNLDVVCHVILKLEDHLNTIIPCPNNQNYSSSKLILSEIIYFAREVLFGSKALAS